MARVLLILVLLDQRAFGQELHWCDGTYLENDLGDENNIDVYFAQAPLFSTNPSIGGKLGAIGLHHSVIIFKQQYGASWTLEFDLTANNKPGAPLGVGSLPEIYGTDLYWDNDAGWCLTDGVLNGDDHYKTSYTWFASIEPWLLRSIIYDFVPSLNGSQGIRPKYNTMRVSSVVDGSELIADTTCGNGAIWVRDYIESQGVEIADVDFKVTRLDVPVLSLFEVTPEMPIEWGRLLEFYQGLIDLANGQSSVDEIIGTLLQELLSLQFIYDSLSGKYYQLVIALGGAFPGFVQAPRPWHLPGYSIVSQASGKCLDVPASNAVNGQQLWQWDCTGFSNQRWVFSNYGAIFNSMDPTKCIDAWDMQQGTQLALWDCNGYPQQHFGFDPDFNTLYLAESEASDATLCMDLSGGSFENGAEVWVWGCNGLAQQNWELGSSWKD